MPLGKPSPVEILIFSELTSSCGEASWRMVWSSVANQYEQFNSIPWLFVAWVLFYQGLYHMYNLDTSWVCYVANKKCSAILKRVLHPSWIVQQCAILFVGLVPCFQHTVYSIDMVGGLELSWPWLRPVTCSTFIYVEDRRMCVPGHTVARPYIRRLFWYWHTQHTKRVVLVSLVCKGQQDITETARLPDNSLQEVVFSPQNSFSIELLNGQKDLNGPHWMSWELCSRKWCFDLFLWESIKELWALLPCPGIMLSR